MILLFIRHAHRTKPQGGKLDNGLSPEGKKQAKRLIRILKPRLSDCDLTEIYTSPKKRCQETVSPLAAALGAEVKVLESLDVKEGVSPNANVRKTLKWLGTLKSECVVLCGHGEWIESFFKLTLKIEAGLDKAGWAEFSLSGGKVRVHAIVPEETTGR